MMVISAWCRAYGRLVVFDAQPEPVAKGDQ